MSEQAQDARTPEKAGALHEVFEIIKTVVYALSIALVLRVLLFQPFTIPSASMVPSLLEGDYVVVSKYSYGWSRHSIPFSPPLFDGRVFGREPHRGDVIVFKLPRDGKTDYVKRLIGLPGDRIQVKSGVVWLNGKPIPRTPLPPAMIDPGFGYPMPVDQFRETLPGGKSYVVNDFGPDGDLDNTEEFLVPEGHYFFMGDNRDNSLDSRAPEAVGVGYVPAQNLEGKAQIVLLSWDKQASIFKPWTWFTHARPSRFFKLVQ
jgi:signal peptidase I